MGRSTTERRGRAATLLLGLAATVACAADPDPEPAGPDLGEGGIYGDGATCDGCAMEDGATADGHPSSYDGYVDGVYPDGSGDGQSSYDGVAYDGSNDGVAWDGWDGEVAPDGSGAPDDPPLAEQNAYGPAARQVWTDAPMGVACRASRAAESAMTMLLTVVAEFSSEAVRPDANGDAPLTLVAQATPWFAGTGTHELRWLAMSLSEAQRDPATGSLLFRTDRYFDAPAGDQTVVTFPPPQDGALSGSMPTLRWPLPLLDGRPFTVRISRAQVQGTLAVDGPGFSLQEAGVTGYVTRTDLADLLARLSAYCQENPASVGCIGFRGLLTPGSCDAPDDCEAGLAAVQNLLGPYEAEVPPDNAEGSVENGACVDASCNAYTLCLTTEFRGVTLSGPVP